MPTFTVQASGSTAVAKNHPNTNYSDLTQYKFFVEPFTGDAGNIKRGDNVYINFPVPGDTYKFKRVTKVTLAFYAQPTAESDATYKGIWTYVNALASQFDADAMTYATRPEIYQTFTGVSEQANGNWTALNEIIQLNAVFDLKNYKSKKEELQQGIRNGFVVALRGGESGTSEAIIFGAKSTRKPSLVCEYSDDTVGITADGFAPTAGAFVNRFEKNMFTWRCDDDTADSQGLLRRDKANLRRLRVARKKCERLKNDQRLRRDDRLHSPCKYIPVRDDRVESKGDGEQRHDNNVRMAGDHDNRRYPDGQAGLPIRHRHRRHHRQPLLVAAHHFHRHAAEQGRPAVVRRRHDVEHPCDRRGRKPVLRRAREQIHKRNKILACAHLQHRRHCRRMERCGTDRCDCRADGSEYPDQEHGVRAHPSAGRPPSRRRTRWSWTGKLSVGTHYGTDKTWTSPAYLADGSHTVRVRVQNQYGMWSDWGAAALPVTNTPGASITLSVQASSVADLNWQTSGSYDFYLVYRNDKPIAKLTQTQYTDELSSGNVIYQVRGCYADSSNYGLSSAVTVTITTGQYVTLYGIASGKKVMLKHCGLKNQPVQNAINRDIQYIFMYGSTYPHAERSEFVTKKVGGTAVFLPGEDKAGFDALIGELVCLKTQSGEMVIGYLNETSDTVRE